MPEALPQTPAAAARLMMLGKDALNSCVRWSPEKSDRVLRHLEFLVERWLPESCRSDGGFPRIRFAPRVKAHGNVTGKS